MKTKLDKLLQPFTNAYGEEYGQPAKRPWVFYSDDESNTNVFVGYSPISSEMILRIKEGNKKNPNLQFVEHCVNNFEKAQQVAALVPELKSALEDIVKYKGERVSVLTERAEYALDKIYALLTKIEEDV